MNDAPSPSDDAAPSDQISVRHLTMAYEDFVVMRDISFDVSPGEIFAIMGGSGCGKSTLMRHMLGMLEPASGEIFYSGESFTRAPPEARGRALRRFGVLFQGGALWSSMTLAENIALPLEEYTDLHPAEIRDIATLKLSLVGLRGFEDYYPSEISGGMRKRAGLARAMALDPAIMFVDEPSAGLDPVSSRLLDDLILELSESFGTTFVVVTHELASIFRIATTSIFLDTNTRTATAIGPPAWLRDHSEDPAVRAFLRRGEAEHE
ncbi:MAG: ATP-binding cassette domain-containing protein [Candidatus Palauibacterales bacterium]|nr:ATP-binding cassette domain-containing protein [Candidatus Palauibacterales bacterium]MDP2481876.1 ATP-binding cassette domain-containing protein [Candidatus Palauibacterales bacterium]